jgi:hypothetical protein
MKKYELHVHTKYSACSNLEPATALRILKRKGYDGIAITDHNTIKGALEAKRINKDKNFEVIVGEEIRSFLPNGGYCHILGYYLKKEIKPGNIFDVVRQIKSQGGVACIAHPFTAIRRAGIDMKTLEQLRGKIAGIESFNARNLFQKMDDKASQAAKKFNFAAIAGSDAHFFFELGHTATKFDEKLNLKAALKKRKTIPVKGTRIFAYCGHFMSQFVRKIKNFKMKRS